MGQPGEALYKFSPRSVARLGTAHQLLQTLFNRVIARKDLPCDIGITCGHRNEADQNRAKAEGYSKLAWPKSPHNSVPSMAVDFVIYIDGKMSWADEAQPLYAAVAKIVFDEWNQMSAPGYRLVWGGHWKMRDFPHFELQS